MAYFREIPKRSLMSLGPISLRSRRKATSLAWIESSARAWKKSDSLTRTSLPDCTSTWKSSCSSSPDTPARPRASPALGGAASARLNSLSSASTTRCCSGDRRTSWAVSRAVPGSGVAVASARSDGSRNAKPRPSAPPARTRSASRDIPGLSGFARWKVESSSTTSPRRRVKLSGWTNQSRSMPITRPAVCRPSSRARSEEHTSELQSLRHLVCRLLLEKKKKKTKNNKQEKKKNQHQIQKTTNKRRRNTEEH